MADARLIQGRADPRLCRSHEIRCTDCGADFYIDLAGLGAETTVQCPGCGDTGTFCAQQIEQFRSDWTASVEGLKAQIQTTPFSPVAVILPHLRRV